MYAARGPEERVFPWGGGWDPSACRTAETIAGAPFYGNDRWRRWLIGDTGDGGWRRDHIAQLDGPTPAGSTWCGQASGPASPSTSRTYSSRSSYPSGSGTRHSAPEQVTQQGTAWSASTASRAAAPQP